MNSLSRQEVSNTMPKRNARPQSRKRQNQNQDSRVADLERRIARLSARNPNPQSNLSPAGKLLISGANTVASFFGAPKIFGQGAYHMNQNSMWNSAEQVPVMHSQSEKIIFRHREYIADIYPNGVTFQQWTYPINPGIDGTFPYLSTIASAFQEYSFKGLVFEFKSTSATALVSGTNTALGSVGLAVQYRSDAAPFISKTQMMNEMWAVDCKPSDNVVLPVECDPRENYTKIQYVRTSNLPPDSDIKTFDLGRLVVATSGFPAGATNTVGELWASYEVELYKPSTTLGGSDVPSLNMQFTGITNAKPFGTSRTTIMNSLSPLPAPWTLGYLQDNNLYFPVNAQGYYLITISVTGPTPTALVYPGQTYSAGITSVAAIGNGGTTSSIYVFNQIVLIIPNGSVQTIGYTGAGTLPSTPTGGSIVVTQLSDDVGLNLYRV